MPVTDRAKSLVGRAWTETRWDENQYQLLDFGDGHKLERFGGVVLNRPCPAAGGARQRKRSLWSDADIRLANNGKLMSGTQPTAPWIATFDCLKFDLRLTPFGHVGLFPEQFENWLWLHRQTRSEIERTGSAPTALNLFAYTGGSTLALASAGANVVHVDASSPAVAWARRNAASSGMQELPIRWIVEDARKFVARELRRGNKYDAIVLDPPSYGHGPKSQSWEIDRDLEPLLADCVQLLHEHPHTVFLATAHSSTPDMRAVAGMLGRLLPQKTNSFDRLRLTDISGRRLDVGFYVRSENAS